MRPVRIAIQYYSGFYIAINLFYDIVSGYREPVATVYAIGYVFTVYILRGKSVSIGTYPVPTMKLGSSIGKLAMPATVWLAPV